MPACGSKYIDQTRKPEPKLHTVFKCSSIFFLLSWLNLRDHLLNCHTTKTYLSQPCNPLALHQQLWRYPVVLQSRFGNAVALGTQNSDLHFSVPTRQSQSMSQDSMHGRKLGRSFSYYHATFHDCQFVFLCDSESTHSCIIYIMEKDAKALRNNNLTYW